MIGKTALALVAAAMIAAAAVLFIWAAAFALFAWLQGPLGQAAASAIVAGAAAVFLGLILLLANKGPADPPPRRDHIPSAAQSLISSIGETIKDRPMLTLGLTVLTGIAATRDPNMLKDLWGAVLHRNDDDRD